MAMYGRHRRSIADIEQQLHDLFDQDPNSYVNDHGVPVIPGDNLIDIFRAYSANNGVELMNDEEIGLMNQLVAANPGLQVTPQVLMQFIAERTKHSPPRSPQSSPFDGLDSPSRGRSPERDAHQGHSRSSSSESPGYRSTPSRPPSRGPQTPVSAKGPSPFDSSRRQRTAPLGTNAPSSWNARPTPQRRRSDAGSRSDSESFSASPSTYGRTPGRTRAPSNPTSPSGMYAVLSSPTTTYRTPSRPHSRAGSHPQPHFNGFGSPGDDSAYPGSPELIEGFRDHHLDDATIMQTISSLPMPRRPGSDVDSDEDDSDLGLVLDRSTASSTASVEPLERVDALTRENSELRRKLAEADRTLQNKITEHELELEELQGRLEELRTELNATKREEKELRSKERQNSTQLSALEAEVAKVTKALEQARSTYASLQRQYQEQCIAAEKYRDDLRIRDESIRTLRESASLHELENKKWNKERDSYETRIMHLEEGLLVAQQAHTQLDEQKQENLMLKETIDRLRFDLDHYRQNAESGVVPVGSGQSSVNNTVGRSWGEELADRLKEEEALNAHAERDDTPLYLDEDDTEGEDIVQTIITRTKRKVGNRANRVETRIEEVKEYCDSWTQHDAAGFSSSISTQTDPEPIVSTASCNIQTDEPTLQTFATQTDPEPAPIPKVTTNISIQTEEIYTSPESSRPVSPHEEAAATSSSSSSTILPSTPKAAEEPLLPHDQPPAYNEHIEEDHNWRVAAETIKKWHPGVKVPFEAIDGGVSEETVEEWKALKEELGVDCIVIDKIIASSEKTQTRSSRDLPSRRGRFYNIYNTYVYGKTSSSPFSSSSVMQTVGWLGVSVLVAIVISPYMVPHYSVPGGPTYYDRAAWSSFNTMHATGEGFAPDGTAAVWNFLGRVGGGAARIARGWPT